VRANVPRVGSGRVVACLALVGCRALQGGGADTEFLTVDAMADAPADATNRGLADGPASVPPFGPDPPPQTCASVPLDGATTLCPLPSPVCFDARYAVFYDYGNDGTCVSGACSWLKVDVDCYLHDGGSCVGGFGDGGVSSSADGGLSIIDRGCLVPLGPAPLPPVVECDADASADAGICAYPSNDDAQPPSVCLGLNELVYYDDGECVAGQCAWQLRSEWCPNGCTSGACNYVNPAITAGGH
jgi:hypothetical protein